MLGWRGFLGLPGLYPLDPSYILLGLNSGYWYIHFILWSDESIINTPNHIRPFVTLLRAPKLQFILFEWYYFFLSPKKETATAKQIKEDIFEQAVLTCN